MAVTSTGDPLVVTLPRCRGIPGDGRQQLSWVYVEGLRIRVVRTPSRAPTDEHIRSVRAAPPPEPGVLDPIRSAPADVGLRPPSRRLIRPDDPGQPWSIGACAREHPFPPSRQGRVAPQLSVMGEPRDGDEDCAGGEDGAALPQEMAARGRGAIKGGHGVHVVDYTIEVGHTLGSEGYVWKTPRPAASRRDPLWIYTRGQSRRQAYAAGTYLTAPGSAAPDR